MNAARKGDTSAQQQLFKIESGEPITTAYHNWRSLKLNQTSAATGTVIQGDCLEVMKSIPSNSVTLILCDLPYGTTKNKWDTVIPLKEMWEEYNRILKADGNIVLTAAQPFTSLLITSNLQMFRYELIWKKSIGSGQLNINSRPLRVHESILIFTKGKSVYNQQMSRGVPYKINRKANYGEGCYNSQVDTVKENEGFRHPTTVLEFPNPRIKNGHPTQKPVDLFKYLINTYSNEGDMVLDNCAGSGTTAIAAIQTGRRYTVIELDSNYIEMINERIALEV